MPPEKGEFYNGNSLKLPQPQLHQLNSPAKTIRIISHVSALSLLHMRDYTGEATSLAATDCRNYT